MNYQHTTASFAGYSIDTFLVNDIEYITPASMAKGIGKTSSQANDYLRRKNKGHLAIDVMVKGGNRGSMQAAKAYPVELVAEMVEYWADKGYAKAKALINSTFRADLIRTVKEANGIQVTAAQHEETRELINTKLVAEYIQGYQRIQEIKETMTTFSTPELDSIRAKRNTIFFEQMTVLEKEVAKELQMDIDYPGWRNDEDPATLVTNRQGQVEVNPDQAAWYQRQQQDVLDKLAQRLQG